MRSRWMVSACLALAACGDSERERKRRELDRQVLEDIGPKADGRLARIAKIVEMLDSGSAPGAFRFADPKPVVHPHDKRNLYVVHESDLRNDTSMQSKPDVGTLHPWLGVKQDLARARAQLASDAKFVSTDPLKNSWKEFLKVEYVLVVRGTLTPPKTHAESDSFTPGRFVGDAQLFGLEGPRHLCGFAVDVRNSDKINFSYGQDKKWTAAHEELQEDLRDQLIRFLRAELVKRGGSPGQPGLGGAW